MSAPAPVPEVMSAPVSVPDILFVDYTLSLVVKLPGPERITGLKLELKLHIAASDANVKNADNADMRVEIVELNKKHSSSEFGIPEELIFVGSLELGKLLTNTSYIGRCVPFHIVKHELKYCTLSDKNFCSY